MSWLAKIDDTGRLLIMTLFTATVALVTALGLDLSAETSAGLTAFFTALLNLVMYFTRPNPPSPPPAIDPPGP